MMVVLREKRPVCDIDTDVTQEPMRRCGASFRLGTVAIPSQGPVKEL